MLSWQHARLDYLNFGDSNTHWFHSRANMRRATNFFEGLFDGDGVLQMEETAMEQISIEYFSTLFSSMGI